MWDEMYERFVIQMTPFKALKVLIITGVIVMFIGWVYLKLVSGVGESLLDKNPKPHAFFTAAITFAEKERVVRYYETQGTLLKITMPSNWGLRSQEDRYQFASTFWNSWNQSGGQQMLLMDSQGRVIGGADGRRGVWVK